MKNCPGCPLEKICGPGEQGKLLYSSIERWNNMLKSLIDLERLDKDFSIEKNLDYSFLENALIQLDINEN